MGTKVNTPLAFEYAFVTGVNNLFRAFHLCKGIALVVHQGQIALVQ